jgi:carbon storage regulator
MLSVTRRPNESITLYTSDGVVEIHLSDIRGNQARIGIEAPKSIKIVRSEIDTPQPKNSFTFMGLLNLYWNK